MGLSWWGKTSEIKPEAYFLFFRPLKFGTVSSPSFAEYNHLKKAITTTSTPSMAQHRSLIEASETKKNDLLFGLHATVHDAMGSELHLPMQQELLPDSVVQFAHRLTHLREHLLREG